MDSAEVLRSAAGEDAVSRFAYRPRLLLAGAMALAAVLVAGSIVLAATTKSGGAVRAVKVVTESGITNPAYTSFRDVEGMSLTMTIPSGEQALLLITFSALTSCVDGTGTTTGCRVRVLVDGAVAPPGEVEFDSALDGDDNLGREANSMQFVAGPLSPGLITVRVQARVTKDLSYVAFTARTLTVLRSKV